MANTAGASLSLPLGTGTLEISLCSDSGAACASGEACRRTQLRPVRVDGARLERAGDWVLQEARREAPGRLESLQDDRRCVDAARQGRLKAEG